MHQPGPPGQPRHETGTSPVFDSGVTSQVGEFLSRSEGTDAERLASNPEFEVVDSSQIYNPGDRDLTTAADAYSSAAGRQASVMHHPATWKGIRDSYRLGSDTDIEKTIGELTEVEETLRREVGRQSDDSKVDQ